MQGTGNIKMGTVVGELKYTVCIRLKRAIMLGFANFTALYTQQIGIETRVFFSGIGIT